MNRSGSGTAGASAPLPSGPEALLCNVQLWRAAGLVPKYLSCQRHVLDAKPHPADPHQDLDQGRFSAYLKRAFLAAAPPNAFHGPVDTLEPVHSGTSLASPGRRQARTSQGAPSAQLPQLQQPHHNSHQHDTHAHAQPSTSSHHHHHVHLHHLQQQHSNAQAASYSQQLQQPSGRGRGRQGTSGRQHAGGSKASPREMVLPDATTPLQPVYPDQHQYCGGSFLYPSANLLLSSQPPSRSTSSTDEAEDSCVDLDPVLDALSAHPKRQRTGTTRQPRRDMAHFCAAFLSFASVESSPSSSGLTGGSEHNVGMLHEAGTGLFLGTREEACSVLACGSSHTHQAPSEDPSSLSLSVSLQSTDTLKGRPLSPSSPLSEGLF